MKYYILDSPLSCLDIGTGSVGDYYIYPYIVANFVYKWRIMTLKTNFDFFVPDIFPFILKGIKHYYFRGSVDLTTYLHFKSPKESKEYAEFIENTTYDK